MDLMITRRGGAAKTSGIPSFTYTGDHLFIDDGGGNWHVKLLTSGTLTFKKDVAIDYFLVGGGASGCAGGGKNYNGGGGGSGYTLTHTITLTANTEYSIIIGAGGAATSTYGGKGNAGGQTSAFGNYVNGGLSGTSYVYGGNGGSGGAGGASNSSAGGTNGGDGSDGTVYSGKGQGTTTRAFGEESGELYATGGASGQVSGSVKDGAANTGDGGDGSKQAGNYGVASGAGGSGIVIIRNSRK